MDVYGIYVCIAGVWKGRSVSAVHSLRTWPLVQEVTTMSYTNISHHRDHNIIQIRT
jgi:hypothetical protein